MGDPFSREVLEFPAVLQLLHGFLTGPIGEPHWERVAPKTDLAKIRRELELAAEAREYLRDSRRPGLGGVCQPRELLDKLTVEGVALEALEILALAEVARAALDMFRTLSSPGGPRPSQAVQNHADVEEAFGHSASHVSRGGDPARSVAGQPQTPSKSSPQVPKLSELARSLPDFRSLLTELGGKINGDGTVDSSASSELARIRRAIERAKAEIQSSLERMLRRFSDVLQDAVVTIRNDRFVIPVRAEEKRRVQGVVHGASSTGATVYIEPLETLSLNNELVELQDREFAEVQRILAEFTRKLPDRREDLGARQQTFWPKSTGLSPRENSAGNSIAAPRRSTPERAISLKDFRHPFLQVALESTQSHHYPLGLELNPPKTIIIISGPNTGGKTVALKALGHCRAHGAGGNSRAGGGS